MDALLRTLEREAEAEIARVLDDARARAVELTRVADESIAARRGATLERRETAARKEHERALAGARHTARAQVLEARAALLDRLFVQIRVALPELARSTAYRRSLATQLRRLSAFAGDQPVTVRCMPALATTLRRLIKTNGHVRIRGDPRIAAGFFVTTVDGALDVDGSLESRLERLRPQLALEALAALSA
jgi:vacuolar-type H+-ATPase subunit E/Vma4